MLDAEEREHGLQGPASRSLHLGLKGYIKGILKVIIKYDKGYSDAW